MLQRHLLSHLHALRERQPLPLMVALPDGTQVALGAPQHVGLRLNTVAAARCLLKPSLDTLGRAYVEGQVELEGRISDMIAVAESLARSAPERSTRGRLPRWLNRHSRRADRAAIAHHYDVSNAFYALWLDPAMVYSCAYFERPTMDLAAAQTAKLDLVCRKLRLAPGQDFLDIGCGWGALVLHAARHYGVGAVGITLSQQQFELARQRVHEAGLESQIDIRLQDYRDLPTTPHFDRIASVGMFEHVGLRNLNHYFSVIQRLLRPGGVALNHGITASDVDSREVGLGAGDFIERYVFPGGELPHVARAIRALSAAGLELVDTESLRPHYALTLQHWSERFERHWTTLEHLAGRHRARVWRLYLAGCAHAFARGWINIYQLLAVRSDHGRSPLPLTRHDLYTPPASGPT